MKNSQLFTGVSLLSQEAAFNSQKAIKETLQTSERTKTLINARATDGNKHQHLAFLEERAVLNLTAHNILIFVSSA